MDNWASVIDAIHYSVGQVLVEEATYDFTRPYRPPSSRLVKGSSFVVAVQDKEIYLLTNAHVVENALNIKLRFMQTGKKDIPATLLAFCYFKDVALLKIKQKDARVLLKQATPLGLADSADVKQADEVIVAGYPLGEENIQFATGVVSGFHTCLDQNTVRTDNGTAYIQITAPLNPGNSGGPAINKQGKVVGVGAAGFMFFQNIGYAIPTRTILAVLPEMIRASSKPSVMLYQPTLGFDWNTGSDELYLLKTGGNKDEGNGDGERKDDKNSDDKETDKTVVSKGGIYVRDVYPNSSFTNYVVYNDDFCQKLLTLIDGLDDYQEDPLAVQAQTSLRNIVSQNQCQDRSLGNGVEANALIVGDILLKLSMPAVYSEAAFDVPLLLKDPQRLLDQSEGDITFSFDNFGQSTVEGDPKIIRNLGFQEVMDTIPIGAPVKLTVTRNIGNEAHCIDLVRPYVAQEVTRWMVRQIYPRFEPERYDYVIFAGLSVAELAKQFNVTQDDLVESSRKFGKYLVVTTVFSGGGTDNTPIVKSGSVLTHVNKHNVKSLEDLRKVLREAKTQPILELKFVNNALVALSMDTVIKTDAEIIDKYSIPETDFLREWLTNG